MTCPNCGKEIKPGKTICRFCGENVGGAAGGRICPNCGASVPAGERFCYNCFNLLDDNKRQQSDQINKMKENIPQKDPDLEPSQASTKTPEIKNGIPETDTSSFVSDQQVINQNQNNNNYKNENLALKGKIDYAGSEEAKLVQSKKPFSKIFIIAGIFAAVVFIAIMVGVNINNSVQDNLAVIAESTPGIMQEANSSSQTPQDNNTGVAENAGQSAQAEVIPDPPEGIYTIYLTTGSKVLNLSAQTDEQSDQDGTNVMIWDSTNSNMQTFRIGYTDQNMCCIYPLSSSNGYDRVISVANDGTGTISEGLNIELRKPDIEMNQLWMIESQGNNTYKIRSAFNENLVMGADLPIQNNSNVDLQTFQNIPEQLWTFVPVNRITAAGKLPNGDADPEEFINQMDDRSITAEELNSFSQEQIGYIRNGIFAISGKIFKTQKYIDYFNTKSWYKPFSSNDDEVKAAFNQFQLVNLEVCLKYEVDHGWR